MDNFTNYIEDFELTKGNTINSEVLIELPFPSSKGEREFNACMLSF